MNNLQKKSLIFNINTIIRALYLKINTKKGTLKRMGLTKNRTQIFRDYLTTKIENCEERMKYTNNEPEFKLILNYLKKMLILVDIVFNNKKINEDDINKIIEFNDLLENNNYIITNNFYEYLLNKILYHNFTIDEVDNIIIGHLNLRNKQNNKNTFNKSKNAIYKEKLKKIEDNINKLKNLINYTI
jgi:hypothetical protein